MGTVTLTDGENAWTLSPEEIHESTVETLAERKSIFLLSADHEVVEATNGVFRNLTPGQVYEVMEKKPASGTGHSAHADPYSDDAIKAALAKKKSQKRSDGTAGRHYGAQKHRPHPDAALDDGMRTAMQAALERRRAQGKSQGVNSPSANSNSSSSPRRNLHAERRRNSSQKHREQDGVPAGYAQQRHRTRPEQLMDEGTRRAMAVALERRQERHRAQAAGYHHPHGFEVHEPLHWDRGQLPPMPAVFVEHHELPASVEPEAPVERKLLDKSREKPKWYQVAVQAAQGKARPRRRRSDIVHEFHFQDPRASKVHRSPLWA